MIAKVLSKLGLKTSTYTIYGERLEAKGVDGSIGASLLSIFATSFPPVSSVVLGAVEGSALETLGVGVGELGGFKSS